MFIETHGAYYFYSKESIRDPSDGNLKSWIRLSGKEEGEIAMYNALASLLNHKKIDEDSMVYVLNLKQIN